ncbi:demethoxyubiquinone hydroxylase family protein [Sporohalobacter salinus]|uniref:demethoxyubiquinone hydroxylase family protein n=1 Tax=Sporohalobacter salinus TaxID=1494606 RepID=UPI001961CD1B|nr:ferritin-like domain-containing protein [Sporohalobacter salinus]MBM7624068.1 bacterioferritin [Sporohalobacter salinus]
MKQEDIIKKLNWFYSLEHNQVDLYTTQSKNTTDPYIKKTFARISTIEQQHVNVIADKIKELGGRPTLLGNVMGSLSGRILGKLTGKIDIVSLLKLNIKLEEKAMKDYKNFIARVKDDSDLYELLWSNSIDEDLHAGWFVKKIKEIEKRETNK